VLLRKQNFSFAVANMCKAVIDCNERVKDWKSVRDAEKTAFKSRVV